MNKPKILIRGTNWIGDAVMTLPAITALAELFPEARLEVLARPWSAPIYRCHPYVDKVFEITKPPHLLSRLRQYFSLAKQLKKRGYQQGLLLPNSFESALVFKLANIPQVIGYSTDMRSILLTKSVRVPADKGKRHEIFYYLNLIKELAPQGWIPPSSPKISLKIPQEAQDRAEKLLSELGVNQDNLLIGLSPGAAFGPAKCWPSHRFKALSRLLLATYPRAKVIIFGSGREEKTGDIIRQVQPDGIINLCGKTSLLEATALIHRLDLMVSNDSGLMHVAAACNIPLVAIFGSTNPTTTGPWSPRATVVRHPLDCSPCLSRECNRDFECMKGISVEEVLQACERQLSHL